MAAKGYLAAFRLVEKSVRRVLGGENAGRVVRKDYQGWYRALFSESVRAGLLESYHLAGHRNAPVFIRTSRHVPPPHAAVNDAMDALLDSLESEQERSCAQSSAIGSLVLSIRIWTAMAGWPDS